MPLQMEDDSIVVDEVQSASDYERVHIFTDRIINLRGIYEPFNHDRRIIGFDTFEGYPVISDKDVESGIIKKGGYTTSSGYMEYLNKLIDYHERENVLYFKRKHKLIKGDVSKMVD